MNHLDCCPSKNEQTLRNWLRLSTEPGLGLISRQQLLAVFGCPHHLYQSSFATLRKICGEAKAHSLLTQPTSERQNYIDRALEWSSQPNQAILHPHHPLYPGSLEALPQPPTILYVQGHLKYLEYPMIAIVGTRVSSPAGVEIAAHFANELSGHGWNIVSGLATGIDRSAHLGALRKFGATTAVLGSGIGHIYPTSNTRLYHQIAEEGLLVSEFPLQLAAKNFHFPLRNRIVAALSRAVIVIEASIKSGSLITAKIANDLHKEVFATPGAIDSPYHKGCHQLIRDGAHLLECVDDIHHVLGIRYPISAHPDTQTEELLGEFSFSPSDPDTDVLCAKFQISKEELLKRLFDLEMQGSLKRTEDGRLHRSAI